MQLLYILVFITVLSCSVDKKYVYYLYIIKYIICNSWKGYILNGDSIGGIFYPEFLEATFL